RVGDLCVLDSLHFIERRKTGFLNCRNVNENVLATVAGLDESITLGRVEPLHRTFSHFTSSPRNQKKNTSRRSPHIPAHPCPQDTRVEADWVAQTLSPFRQKNAISYRISAFLLVLRAFDAAKSVPVPVLAIGEFTGNEPPLPRAGGYGACSPKPHGRRRTGRFLRNARVEWTNFPVRSHAPFSNSRSDNRRFFRCPHLRSARRRP